MRANVKGVPVYNNYSTFTANIKIDENSDYRDLFKALYTYDLQHSDTVDVKVLYVDSIEGSADYINACIPYFSLYQYTDWITTTSQAFPAPETQMFYYSLVCIFDDNRLAVFFRYIDASNKLATVKIFEIKSSIDQPDMTVLDQYKDNVRTFVVCDTNSGTSQGRDIWFVFGQEQTFAIHVKKGSNNFKESVEFVTDHSIIESQKLLTSSSINANTRMLKTYFNEGNSTGLRKKTQDIINNTKFNYVSR